MWDKLSVKQFITLYDIELNANLNTIEKQQKMVAVVEGKEEENYDDIKYRELVQLYSEKLKFFNDIPNAPSVPEIKVNGNKYKFCYELSNITAGQYIDFKGFSGNIMDLNKMAGVFFLPIIDGKVLPYGEIPHEVVAEQMLDANFLEVYGCMLFFCKLFKALIKDSLNSIPMTEETKENLTRFLGTGDGL
jgi:hypothetical protein